MVAIWSAADTTNSAIHVGNGGDAGADLFGCRRTGRPDASAPVDHDDGTAEGLQPHAFAIVRIGRSGLEQPPE
jgi:hypothetical protein